MALELILGNVDVNRASEFASWWSNNQETIDTVLMTLAGISAGVFALSLLGIYHNTKNCERTQIFYQTLSIPKNKERYVSHLGLHSVTEKGDIEKMAYAHFHTVFGLPGYHNGFFGFQRGHSAEVCQSNPISLLGQWFIEPDILLRTRQWLHDNEFIKPTFEKPGIYHLTTKGIQLQYYMFDFMKTFHTYKNPEDLPSIAKTVITGYYLINEEHHKLVEERRSSLR